MAADAVTQARTTPTICRLRPAHCGVLAIVVDGRLTPNDVDYDPISGIPRMGSMPVSVTPGGA
jgi:hypothetical protein